MESTKGEEGTRNNLPGGQSLAKNSGSHDIIKSTLHTMVYGGNKISQINKGQISEVKLIAAGHGAMGEGEWMRIHRVSASGVFRICQRVDNQCQ